MVVVAGGSWEGCGRVVEGLWERPHFLESGRGGGSRPPACICWRAREGGDVVGMLEGGRGVGSPPYILPPPPSSYPPPAPSRVSSPPPPHTSSVVLRVPPWFQTLIQSFPSLIHLILS